MVDISVFSLFSEWLEKFQKADIDNAENEILWIFEKNLSIKKEEILLRKDSKLIKDQVEACLSDLYKRVKRTPLQYILGSEYFFGREFLVGPGVLIPRFETECICKKAIEKILEKRYKSFIDICGGTGCIGITIEKEVKDVSGFILEKSDRAFDYLKKNYKLYNSSINLIKEDIFSKTALEKINMEVDMVVSNPPYLTMNEIDHLQSELRYEPIDALYGSFDGLSFYRRISSLTYDKINSGGMILFEVGYTQFSDVKIILTQNGFNNIDYVLDQNNLVRGVYGFK